MFTLNLSSIFNKKLLLIVGFLLPCIGQAFYYATIYVHETPFYFLYDGTEAEKEYKEVKKAIHDLQELLDNPNSLCLYCQCLSDFSIMLPKSSVRACYRCSQTHKINLEPWRPEPWPMAVSGIAFRENDKLNTIYKILNKYACYKDQYCRSINLNVSFDNCSKRLSINCINPKKLRELSSDRIPPKPPILEPVERVDCVTTLFAKPNTWHVPTQRVHQNPTQLDIEKLINVKDIGNIIITKPDSRKASWLYLIDRNNFYTCLGVIIADKILYLDFDESERQVIYVVLHNDIMYFNKIHLDTLHTVSCSIDGNVTDKATVQAFILKNFYYFLIEDQGQTTVKTNRKTNATCNTIKSFDSVCPSVGYQDNDSVYIYSIQKSYQDNRRLDINLWSFGSKGNSKQNITPIDVAKNCLISLAPNNDYLVVSSDTCIYTLSIHTTSYHRWDFAKGSGMSLEIDWHPEKPIFAQHSRSGTLILNNIATHTQIIYPNERQGMNKVFFLPNNLADLAYTRGVDQTGHWIEAVKVAL